jgi:hypothetical protein
VTLAVLDLRAGAGFFVLMGIRVGEN